jgi:hypothetical protein
LRHGADDASRERRASHGDRDPRASRDTRVTLALLTRGGWSVAARALRLRRPHAQVWPNNAIGVRKPPWFIFLPSYWCGAKVGADAAARGTAQALLGDAEEQGGGAAAHAVEPADYAALGEPTVVVKNLRKTFGSFQAVRGISFEVRSRYTTRRINTPVRLSWPFRLHRPMTARDVRRRAPSRGNGVGRASGDGKVRVPPPFARSE